MTVCGRRSEIAPICRSINRNKCYTESDNMVHYDLLHGAGERSGGPNTAASVHYDSHGIQQMCV